MNRAFRLWELAPALLVLSVLSVFLFGSHLRHGGFYLDDWSNGIMALHPPGSPEVAKALSSFADFTLYRPVLVVYVPLVYFIFGTHMHFHLAWAVLLAVMTATLFYGTLRTLGVPWAHAWLIAALTVVFPWSDSTRLWATGDQVTLSVFFMMAGLFVALRVLNRRIWPWHGFAAVLFLISILTYEVTLPIVACAGVLYRLQAGWLTARWRWLTDLVVVAIGGGWVLTHTPKTASGFSGDFEHLRQIVSAGGTLLGRAGLAIGPSHTTTALCVLAAVIAAGLAMLLKFPRSFSGEKEWGLRKWLYLAVAGLFVAALGWAVFIPADTYYTPSVYGETNRVNGLAAFGLILAVYGGFGMIGSLLGRVRPSARRLPTLATVLLGMALLASYSHVLRRHISIWDTAYANETAVLAEVKEKLPHLPHGTRVIISSSPANQTLGVPIFTAWWDLDGAVKFEYDDSTLSARPIVEGLSLKCRAHKLVVSGRADDPHPGVPYGTARLLDLQTGSLSAPHNQTQCLRVAKDYVPGPLYLSAAY